MNLWKKNKKIQVIVFILANILVLLVDKTACLAASASITISTKEASYEKGATLTIEIKINSKEMIGDFEGFLTYDADILEFVSESSFIAGGEGLIKISDINVSTGEDSKKYIAKFFAKEVGSTVIAFRETASIYEFESGSTMSVSSNQLEVDVISKALASDNGDLKELKVEPGKLTPDFDPQIIDYSVSVASDVNQMIISSIPSDEKARISIEGNKALKPGENTILITVKAESGVEKLYTILVLKKENEKDKEIKDPDDELINSEEENNEYNSKDNTVTLSKPKIIRENGDTYYINGFKYQLLTPKNDIQIPEGFIPTSIVIDNQTMEVYSLEGEPEYEFLLVYAKGPSGKEGFYLFDKLENTLQRYQGGPTLLPEDTVNSDGNSNKENEFKLVVMGVILVVLTAVCIVITLSLVQSRSRNKRRKK